MHLTTISSSYQQQDQTHSDNPTQTIMCCLPAQKGILPCRMISSMIQYQQLNACDRGFHSVLFGCDDGSISLETLTIPVVVCGCGGRGHTLVTNVMDQANPKPYTTLCVQVRARFCGALLHGHRRRGRQPVLPGPGRQGVLGREVRARRRVRHGGGP